MTARRDTALTQCGRRTSPLRALLVASVILALCMPAAASAAPSSAELKRQMDALQADVREAGRDYDKAFWKFDESQARKSKVEKRLKSTRGKLAKSREKLGRRVDVMYRTQGNIDMLSVVLASEDFTDLVTRLQFFQRIGNADAENIAEIEALQRQLSVEKKTLEEELHARREAVRELQSERDRLQKRLAEKQGEYKRLQAKYVAVTKGSTSGSRAPAGPNGMVFPVDGPNYYSDTWGASRSGGRRAHKGTDIMASRGTPCVAVLSGTVTSKAGGLGGLTIWLRADNGWSFYYAHLNGYAVRSGRVSAGQVIGYVGSTGNAAASSPHLHFQIHPGGASGAPVNPYPYLRGMQ